MCVHVSLVSTLLDPMEEKYLLDARFKQRGEIGDSSDASPLRQDNVRASLCGVTDGKTHRPSSTPTKFRGRWSDINLPQISKCQKALESSSDEAW